LVGSNEVIEVPLMGCNATVNVVSAEKVEREMPEEFSQWLECDAALNIIINMPVEPAVRSAMLSPGLAKCTARPNDIQTSNPESWKTPFIFGSKLLRSFPNAMRSISNLLSFRPSTNSTNKAPCSLPAARSDLASTS